MQMAYAPEKCAKCTEHRRKNVYNLEIKNALIRQWTVGATLVNSRLLSASVFAKEDAKEGWTENGCNHFSSDHSPVCTLIGGTRNTSLVYK